MAKKEEKTSGPAVPKSATDPAVVQARIDEQAEARRQADTDAQLAFIAKLKKEQEEALKLRPLPPITQSTPGRQARPDDDVVLMMFPHPMFIWADPVPDHANPVYHRRCKIAFGAGVQEVPESLVDNWYLKNAGVKPLRAGKNED